MRNNIKNNKDSIVGNIYGNLKVLKFERSELNRHYYNTLCLNCNTESIRRVDHFRKNPKYCKSCRKESYVKPKIQSVINGLYCSYRTGANYRNLEFSLSLEEFTNLISKNCEYCGTAPEETKLSKYMNKTNEVFKHNGIDRIHNDYGYFLFNCVPCCKNCNMMKKDLTYKDFLLHVTKIVEHNKVNE